MREEVREENGGERGEDKTRREKTAANSKIQEKPVIPNYYKSNSWNELLTVSCFRMFAPS